MVRPGPGRRSCPGRTVAAGGAPGYGIVTQGVGGVRQGQSGIQADPRGPVVRRRGHVRPALLRAGRAAHHGPGPRHRRRPGRARRLHRHAGSRRGGDPVVARLGPLGTTLRHGRRDQLRRRPGRAHQRHAHVRIPRGPTVPGGRGSGRDSRGGHGVPRGRGQSALRGRGSRDLHLRDESGRALRAHRGRPARGLLRVARGDERRRADRRRRGRDLHPVDPAPAWFHAPARAAHGGAGADRAPVGQLQGRAPGDALPAGIPAHGWFRGGVQLHRFPPGG